MSRFYSMLLDDEMHDALKKRSYETGEHISNIVRKGITFILKNTKSPEDKKNENQKQGLHR